MGILKYTTEEVENILDGRYNSFRQDIVDSLHTSGSPQSLLAATEYRITNDALSRNNVVSPAYITDRWDATNNKIALATELDSPVYEVDISFTFSPAVAAEGEVITRIYIDDTVPKLIKTATAKYKQTTSIDDILMAFYLGTETGYDAKNDGVYFTIEFSGAGDLYDKSLTIFRT